MKTYFVNLDYESFLFNPLYKDSDPKNLKMIKEFEYIFFLVNTEECILKNVNQYSNDYLNHLISLGFQIPILNSNSNEYINWWGLKINKELESVLNSKLTSAQISKDHFYGFENGEIVDGLDKLNEFIKNKKNEKWILKNPFGFSGIGHTIFKKNEVPLVKFDGLYLLEPVYERIADFGITFVQKDSVLQEMFIVENFNNQSGSFKGGLGFKKSEDFFEYVLNKYHYDLKKDLLKYEKIFKIYQSLGATSNVQIDSFLYQENGEIKNYILVEVNYRKTMGLVIHSLAQRMDCKYIEWRVTHTAELENKKEWIKLSSSNNKFNSYMKLGN